VSARIDLDAIDLTALVEVYAERIFEGARVGAGVAAADDMPWADLPPMKRFAIREALTKPVHDVLTALREQAVT
jgi:hypothetical protein